VITIIRIGSGEGLLDSQHAHSEGEEGGLRLRGARKYIACRCRHTDWDCANWSSISYQITMTTGRLGRWTSWRPECNDDHCNSEKRDSGNAPRSSVGVLVAKECSMGTTAIED